MELENQMFELTLILKKACDLNLFFKVLQLKLCFFIYFKDLKFILPR